ncbi:MAG: type II toxin-antitoxin system RelE/ParE family toxin [Pseudomonadota bacterium]|nr:type II toxin-antitoxin system RelE/ParE family toxin [Pseudomonadota bacterium]
MPQVRFAPSALRDLQRLREFIRVKNPAAARRAAAAIIRSIQVLGLQPNIGRPVDNMDMVFRELPIDFGDTGYIARYHYAGDEVTVLGIRHQKEVGF